MITTIVFDIGNVLINWEREHLYKKIFTDKKQMQWFLDNVCTWEWNEQQDGGKKIAVAVAEKIAEFPEYEKEIRMFYNRFDEMIGGAIESTVNVLRQLKENGNYNLYVLSNWSEETWPKVSSSYPFLSWFDGLVISGKEKTNKPKADIYEILTTRYNKQPNEIVFIDDRQINLDTAQDLGWNTILFTNELNLKIALKDLGIEI